MRTPETAAPSSRGEASGNPTLLAPCSSCTLSLQDCEEINLSCLNHPVCGTWFWHSSKQMPWVLCLQRAEQFISCYLPPCSLCSRHLDLLPVSHTCCSLRVEHTSPRPLPRSFPHCLQVFSGHLIQHYKPATSYSPSTPSFSFIASFVSMCSDLETSYIMYLFNQRFLH